MGEFEAGSVPPGGHMERSAWQTRIEYFYSHPEYVMQVQHGYANYVRVVDDGGTVFIIGPADSSESFYALEHGYWARQQANAASDATHLPKPAREGLDEHRLRNPRVETDLSLPFALRNLVAVSRMLESGGYVYLSGPDMERSCVLMSEATFKRDLEMEDDYLARSASEAYEPGATISQEELDAELDEIEPDEGEQGGGR